MDLGDDLGLGQDQEVVVALEIARMIFEAIATIARLIELIALNHGAHGTIENEDARFRFTF